MLHSAMIQSCRDQFPALRRRLGEIDVVFLDGPAGTQVPQVVIDAISRYLRTCNANRGGRFLTGEESDRWLDAAHRAAADLLGANDPDCVAFGPNMTTLTFALSRALGRIWKPGDEIVVTRLEHDANFTPWVLAARDAGATVRYVDVRPEDCTLDLEHFRSLLNERTRLVAVGCASNATGTRNPVQQICGWAREVGAWSFLDAVHFAPHDLIDVNAWGCDFLACSAYKFFGPHVGLLWGRRERLEAIEPYKLRPAPDGLPGRWMTGTQNHEGLAGTMSAIDYLSDLGRRLSADSSLDRRPALAAAYDAIVSYESALVWRLIEGLESIPGIRIYGITDRTRDEERMPTVAWNHPNLASRDVAERLGRQGFCLWHGNYYALPLTEALGLEPEGMVRVGMVHYNTIAEIDRLVEAIGRLPRIA